MTKSIILGLIQNIAILLSFSMLYDYIWSENKKNRNFLPDILTGVILGIIGTVLILTPWHFVPGIFFDTRSVMLSISGLFFGPVPTLIAMIITALYRLYVGGGGSLMGVAVIFSSGTIGLIWSNYRPEWYKNHTKELLSMGLTVHLLMLGCTSFLPEDLRWETFRNIALPVIIIYPIATVLLGKLMLKQSDNRETRIALNVSEKRWLFALEGAGDGVFDRNLQTAEIFFSKQWKQILGYEEHEIANSYNEWEKRVHPDDTEMVYKSLNRHLEGKTPVYLAEYRMQCKDGNYKWILARGKVMTHDQDGKPLRIIGTHTDITERKLTQEKIKKISLHYKALIEKAPDGIVLMDVEGNFKFLSPSALKIYGYSEAGEIKGRSADYIHPDDLPVVMATIQDMIQSPSLTPTIQYRFIDKSGSWKWAESTFSNLLTDESVEAIVVNFRDITESQKAQEEIKKLNEELEKKVTERTIELEKRRQELMNNETALLNLVEDLNLKSAELQKSTTQLELINNELEAFSYSVSHDLRAPLRAINGFINILFEDYEPNLDAEGKRICGIIQSNALKMGQLIDDLLSFSRLMRSELHHSRIDMESMVKNVISEFATIQDLSGKTIDFQGLNEGLGDQNMIKQVWINLISNAIKYTSKTENAQITIGSYINDGEHVYYIKDNGVGFNMNYVHKLFGVFHRLHNVNEFEGTGVGLAIVQRIIKRHRGRVWAEGEIGKGASFYFTLPVS